MIHVNDTLVENENSKIIVNKDEIVIGENGGFDYNYVFENVNNSVGDIINEYTKKVTSIVNDNSSRITEITNLNAGIQSDLVNANARFHQFREAYASTMEAYAKEIKTLEASFNKSLASLTQELTAYASDNLSLVSKVEEYRTNIDNASANYLNQINALTQQIEGGVTSTATQLSNLNAKINETEASITNAKNTLVSKIEKVDGDLTNKIVSVSTSVREELAVATNNTAVKIQDVKTLALQNYKEVNNNAASVKNASEAIEGLSSWQAQVKQIITSPNGDNTGFDFGSSSDTKSHFNIYADNINMNTSDGTNIMHMENGKVVINGTLIQKGTLSNFYKVNLVFNLSIIDKVAQNPSTYVRAYTMKNALAFGLCDAVYNTIALEESVPYGQNGSRIIKSYGSEKVICFSPRITSGAAEDFHFSLPSARYNTSGLTLTGEAYIVFIRL